MRRPVPGNFRVHPAINPWLVRVEGAYVVLEGRQQKKPNSFIEMNQRACEYFERAYGSLEALTNKKIRFLDTLVCNYSEGVLPKIKDKRKFKGSNKSGKATTLNFLVSVFSKNGRTVLLARWRLPWRLPGSFRSDRCWHKRRMDSGRNLSANKKRGTSWPPECGGIRSGWAWLPVSVFESMEGFR